MEKRERSARTGKVLAVLLAIAFLAASLAFARTSFDHQKHLDEGLSCDDCHNPASGNRAIMPQSCLDCHDEFPTVTTAEASRFPIAFDHRPHTESFECSRCHATTGAAEDARYSKPLAEECFSCHKESDVTVAYGNCANCHAENPRRIKPAGHTAAWSKVHGKHANLDDVDGHTKNCTACHDVRNQCYTCHRRTQPASHTALWRMRTHGQSALLDRDSCRTCHRSAGYCISCHRNTRPITHTGTWSNTHGRSLQGESWSTVEGTGCRVCHQVSFCADCHR